METTFCEYTMFLFSECILFHNLNCLCSCWLTTSEGFVWSMIGPIAVLKAVRISSRLPQNNLITDFFLRADECDYFHTRTQN